MNPSACRISYQSGRTSWCGTGSIAGYEPGPQGAALIVTNAHVSGRPDAPAKRTARFVVNGQTQEHDASEILAYAFSDSLAVDWAVLRCPTLQRKDGLPAFPLLKTKPVGTQFRFTGSPSCVWPQTHVTVRLTGQSPARGVQLWLPRAIGGQSGSNLLADIDGDTVAQLLLTWDWASRGAGQETFQIFNNVLNANNAAPTRPEGLTEVGYCSPDLLNGYWECDEIKQRCNRGKNREAVLAGVQSLPIWYGDNVVDPPVNPEEDKLKKLARAVVEGKADYESAIDELRNCLNEK